MISWIASFASVWLQTHAPALIVAIPLIAAPICVLIANGRTTWIISIAVTAICTFFAVVLLDRVQELEGEAISYALGGWKPPIGIEFRIDSLNVFILLLVTVIGFLASIFSWPSVRAEIRHEKLSLFYATYLVCFTGLLGVSITGDAFNLFVFLEIGSIATYALVALGVSRDRRALPAAFNYLLMGTIGATFFVIGVGFLYAATGTLNMADIASRLPAIADKTTVQAAFAFITIGLGIKLAMWPLHQWLPNAYAYSPSMVVVFLSATATKVALYALVRFLFSVFSLEFAFEGVSFGWLLMPLGLVAMMLCSFQAIFQADIRRTLAYSSVAQVGYMILGISLGTALGLGAGLLHLINHALMKGVLFMSVAGLFLRFSGMHIRDLSGVGRTAPWTMSAFTIGALSLIGVPLTAGFQSKFALLNASLDQGLWWVAGLIVISSFLAVIYMGRILEIVFFRPAPEDSDVRNEAPILILIPIWILALANIWYGVDVSFLNGLTRSAAEVAFSVESLR